MCEPGAVGLNCSRDVECRYWVDSRKQWEQEGCLRVDPPGGKFDGFLHCKCYLSGMFAGIAIPWIIPPPPIIYDIFANPDILQTLPAIDLPFNMHLVLTLVVLVFCNVLSLGWAKFRVHRRATIQQRASDARRKLSRMSYVCSKIGDEPEPQYVPPTEGALKFVGQTTDKPGSEAAPKRSCGTADMLKAVVLAAQRRAQSLPSEAIQDRVPIAALVEASRTNKAISSEEVVANGPASPVPGQPPELQVHGDSARPSDADAPEPARRHSWSPARGDEAAAGGACFGPGMVQQHFSMVPLSPATAGGGPEEDTGGQTAPPVQRTRIEMVREQQICLAMRDQQSSSPVGTPVPPQLPRILQNRVPNYSPQAGLLCGFARAATSRAPLPPLTNKPSTPAYPRGVSSRNSSIAPGAGYISPYAQRPCRGAPTAASAVRQQISSGRLPLPPSLAGGAVSVPRGTTTAPLWLTRGPAEVPPSPPTSPPEEEEEISPPAQPLTEEQHSLALLSMPYTPQLTQSRVGNYNQANGPAFAPTRAPAPDGVANGRWWCSTGEGRLEAREAIRGTVQSSPPGASAASMPPSESATQARSGAVSTESSASTPPVRRGRGSAPHISVLASPESPDVDERPPEHAGWCRDSPQWTRCNAQPSEPTRRSSSAAGPTPSAELSPSFVRPQAAHSSTPARFLNNSRDESTEAAAAAVVHEVISSVQGMSQEEKQPSNPQEPAAPLPSEEWPALPPARSTTPSSRSLTSSFSSRRLGSLAAPDHELTAGPSESPAGTSRPPAAQRQGTETPPRWVRRLNDGTYGDKEPIVGNYRACRTPLYPGTPPYGSRPRTPNAGSRLPASASAAQLGLGAGCALSQDEMGDNIVERAVTPPGAWSPSGTGVGDVRAVAPGRRACPFRADIPTQTCAMAPSSWFAPADGTAADGTAAFSRTAMRSGSLPATRQHSNHVPQRRASVGCVGNERGCGYGCGTEEGADTSAAAMLPAPAAAVPDTTASPAGAQFRMAMRSRVSMTAGKEDEDTGPRVTGEMQHASRRVSRPSISCRFFQKKEARDDVGASLRAPKGSPSGLAALAKLQAAGRTVTNTIKVRKIFVPPKAPPPPTMWATIKNEHLLVATFWSADSNYAKVQKGQSQLRETQLVQIVYNTLMFQLGLLVLLAWRFTDFETVLTGPMIFAAGTLAAFVSAAFTLLCKGVFRWGNTRRWKVRRSSRLSRLSQWVRSAAKEEGGVRVAVMKQWWEYRTSSLRRATPKKALSRMAVVVRQNFSWFFVVFAYFAALAIALVFGLSFDGGKYYSVLGSWAVSLAETWLLVEPSVVFIMIILPRILDEAMTPASAMSEEEKAARKRKRASLLIHRLEAPQKKRLPFKSPAALSAALFKPKNNRSAKYAP